jgi:hypothetical protein
MTKGVEEILRHGFNVSDKTWARGDEHVLQVYVKIDR